MREIRNKPEDGSRVGAPAGRNERVSDILIAGSTPFTRGGNPRQIRLFFKGRAIITDPETIISDTFEDECARDCETLRVKRGEDTLVVTCICGRREESSRYEGALNGRSLSAGNAEDLYDLALRAFGRMEAGGVSLTDDTELRLNAAQMGVSLGLRELARDNR